VPGKFDALPWLTGTYIEGKMVLSCIMYEKKCPLVSFEKDQPFPVAGRWTKAVCVVLLGRNLLVIEE
jgi:hypothetical protein